jgi:hypothetical protein
VGDSCGLQLSFLIKRRPDDKAPSGAFFDAVYIWLAMQQGAL